VWIRFVCLIHDEYGSQSERLRVFHESLQFGYLVFVVERHDYRRLDAVRYVCFDGAFVRVSERVQRQTGAHVGERVLHLHCERGVVVEHEEGHVVGVSGEQLFGEGGLAALRVHEDEFR